MAGGAAVLLLAVSAAWAAVVIHGAAPRPSPGPVGPVAANDAPVVAPTQVPMVPAHSNVSLVVVTDESPSTAARMAKYVAAGTKVLSVEVVSDGDLMMALAATGNNYGLIRIGDRMDVKCYSCDEGVEAPTAPAPDR